MNPLLRPSPGHVHAVRGTRRTRAWAGWLAAGVMTTAFVGGAVLMVGLWVSVQSERETPALLTVHLPPLTPVTPEAPRVGLAVADPAEAPSRLAPVARPSGPDAVATPVRAEGREVRFYDQRPIRPVRTMTMLTTAYSPDARSCGVWADGITASGFSVYTHGGKLVAADTNILPFGSLVSIPGYNGGRPVPVLDRGGAIKGQRLDLLYPTHEQALQWGVQRLEVTVWEYADQR